MIPSLLILSEEFIQQRLIVEFKPHFDPSEKSCRNGYWPVL
jgi:hypothetical protein